MEENLNNVTWKIILIFRSQDKKEQQGCVIQNSARKHGRIMSHVTQWLTERNFSQNWEIHWLLPKFYNDYGQHPQASLVKTADRSLAALW